jgi:hypothetical protein
MLPATGRYRTKRPIQSRTHVAPQSGASGFILVEVAMTLKQLQKNAANCAFLAELAPNGPSRRRYQRMHASWLALMETEAWLDGEVPPNGLPPSLNRKSAVNPA